MVVVAVTQLLPAILGQQAAADWASEPGRVEQASFNGVTATTGNGHSFDATVSADGNIVAFASYAINLDPDSPDPNSAYSDIYVWNRSTHRVFRVTPNETPAQGPSYCRPNCVLPPCSPECTGSRKPALSADGRTLVYESDRPLTPLAANQSSPYLLRPWMQLLDADGARLDGRLPEVVTNPSARAGEPAISGDGLWIAFTTSGPYSPYAETGREYDRCSCGEPGDAHVNDDVYLADLRFPNFAPNNPRLISQVPGPLGKVGNGPSGQPSLNDNGSIVTFTSRATDLIPGGDPGGAAPSVFRRQVDQVTTDPFLSPINAGGTTTLVATATDGRAVHEAVVSADGNRVAYTVSEPVLSLSPASVDFGEVSTSTFAVAGITIANTGGGDMPWTLAFEGPNAGEFQATHSCAATLFGRESCSITVRLTPTATGPRTATLRVTTAVGAPVATSKTLTLSGLGVAGAPSTAVPPTTPTTTPTVVPPGAPLDANGADDVYVKDVVTNAVIAVTLRTPTLCGGCSAHDTRNPDLSDDGSTVAFESASADLHAGDTNDNDDVFVRVISSPMGPIERASLTFQQLELQAGAESRNASLSVDGTYVAFDTDAENPGPTYTAVIPTPSWPVTSPPTAVAAPPSAGPSTTGRTAATQPRPGLVPGATRDVFERRRDPIPFFDPNPVTLSAVEVDTDSAPQTLTLRNTGPGPVQLLGSPTVTVGAWRIVAGAGTTCASGLTLYRGQACTVQVVVHPTSTGHSAATLTVPASAGPNLLPGAPVPPITAVLTATGVTAPFTYTNELQFGSVPPGTPSGLQPVTITNTGANPQVVGPLSITGPNAADFTIDPTSTCTSAPLPPGGSCVVYVRFTPGGTGSRSASLAGTFAGTPFTVPLLGSGTPTTTTPPTTIPLPTVSIQPSPVDFGVVDLGAAPVSRTATVTNQGPGVLVISGVALRSGTPDFALASQDCTGRSLTAGASCTVGVTFAPTVLGARNGEVAVDSNAGQAVVALTGSGRDPQVVLLPDRIDFGEVGLGTTATSGVVITNPSTGTYAFGPVTITGANAGDFTVAANLCADGPLAPLAPGARCVIAVDFKPQALGEPHRHPDHHLRRPGRAARHRAGGHRGGPGPGGGARGGRLRPRRRRAPPWRRPSPCPTAAPGPWWWAPWCCAAARPTSPSATTAAGGRPFRHRRPARWSCASPPRPPAPATASWPWPPTSASPPRSPSPAPAWRRPCPSPPSASTSARWWWAPTASSSPSSSRARALVPEEPLRGLTIAGPNEPDFRIATQACTAAAPDGTSCTVEVRLIPSGVGPRNATLAGTFGPARTAFSVELVGEGVTALPPPAAEPPAAPADTPADPAAPGAAPGAPPAPRRRVQPPRRRRPARLRPALHRPVRHRRRAPRRPRPPRRSPPPSP